MASIKDPFSQFLVKRLQETQAFNVWMHAHRELQDDICHMAIILMINRENFERALRYSSLTSLIYKMRKSSIYLKSLYADLEPTTERFFIKMRLQKYIY